MINPTFEVGQSFTVKGIAVRQGQALDLTGATGLSVKLKKPSGESEFVTPVVTDAVNGRFGFGVSAAFNDEGRWIDFRLSGVDANGDTINGKRVRIIIKKAF